MGGVTADTITDKKLSKARDEAQMSMFMKGNLIDKDFKFKADN